MKEADGQKDRIWFVRHGDETEDLFEEMWDVELYHGQYVNCAGFFVSEEPCKPEHRDMIFNY